MAKQLFFVAFFFIAYLATVMAAAAGAAPIRADQSPAHIIPKDNLKVKVCGSYCGPNWCANQVLAEDRCVASGAWGIPGETAVDDCCRTHDSCCGRGVNRPSCNTAIVDCIQRNKAYWSFCGAAVWAAMKAVSGWCCGSACPTFHDPSVPLTLAGKVFADDLVRITFTSDSKYTVEAVKKAEDGALLLADTAATSVCQPQTYALGVESLQVNLGPMMSLADNKCGLQLQTVTPRHDLHPLLDSPDTVLYWPTADVLSISMKDGSVPHKLHRVL